MTLIPCFIIQETVRTPTSAAIQHAVRRCGWHRSPCFSKTKRSCSNQQNHNANAWKRWPCSRGLQTATPRSTQAGLHRMSSSGRSVHHNDVKHLTQRLSGDRGTRSQRQRRTGAGVDKAKSEGKRFENTGLDIRPQNSGAHGTHQWCFARDFARDECRPGRKFFWAPLFLQTGRSVRMRNG